MREKDRKCCGRSTGAGGARTIAKGIRRRKIVQFFHHRPFQLERAESLRLWMKKDEVERVLGPPNRIFGKDDHAFWYYYASNGTKLSVRFMDDGVLGEAEYYSIGEKRRQVTSIERELNGRDIFKLLQERATKRSEAWLAQKREESRVDQAARSEAAAPGDSDDGFWVDGPECATEHGRGRVRERRASG